MVLKVKIDSGRNGDGLRGMRELNLECDLEDIAAVSDIEIHIAVL